MIANFQENIRNAFYENANEKDNESSLEEDSEKDDDNDDDANDNKEGDEDDDDDDWRFACIECFQLLLSFIFQTFIESMFCKSL